MYKNGEELTRDEQFEDHLGRDVPVQIYRGNLHSDIGFVQAVLPDFIRVNDTFYRRDLFTFISRPGY